MKRYKWIVGIFLLGIISACSKSNSSLSTNIAGTWVFKSQNGLTFSFPSVLTNPTPISVSNWSTTQDSIKVNFENNGRFSFFNYRLPVDVGAYKIVQDSLLVLQPDTSGLLKFCFSSMTVYSGYSTTPPQPYADFHYSSDTLLFKRSGNDLGITAYWLSKVTVPIQPNQDSLILHQTISYFKKL